MIWRILVGLIIIFAWDYVKFLIHKEEDEGD